MQINDLVRQIQQLQRQTNDAVVKKQTAIAKKQSVLKDIEQLKAKSMEQFGCDIEDLQSKKTQYTQQINDKIANLKRILGI